MATLSVEYVEQTIEPMLGSLDPYYERQETSRVKKVQKRDDGWDVTTENSMGCFVQRKEIPSSIRYNIDIKVGDALTTYSYGGMRIAGFALNGQVLYVKSERELNLEWLLFRAQHVRELEARFEHSRKQLDLDYAGLPQVFKDRIDRFRKNNPDFRKEYEAYEMICCTSAVQLAERAAGAAQAGENQQEVDEFFDSEELRLLAAYPRDEPWEKIEGPPEMRWLWWWWALNTKAYDYQYERQGKLMPGWDEAGHSGNTAGASFFLARAYMEAPEYIEKIHGTLSPLVGSEAFGDVAR